MKLSKKTTRQPEEDATSRRHNRRQALALGGAAAAAAAVAALGMNGGKKAQAGHDATNVFHLGEINTANQPTVLQANQQIGASLHVENRGGGNINAIIGVTDGAAEGQPAGVTGINEAVGPNAGPGVVGFSKKGFGVYGATEGDEFAAGMTGNGGEEGRGVLGSSGSGLGVYGISETGIGVNGQHQSATEWGSGVWGLNLGIGPGVEGRADGEGPGVFGWKPPWATGPGAAVEGQSDKPGSPGVQGDSPSGVGVAGKSDSGIGVRGDSQSGTGVECYSQSGPALAVYGQARFSTVGAGEVRAWRRVAQVSNPAVTGDSHITVSFTGNPGRARVAWVERHPASGFVVHLSGRPWSNVPFTYLIVEPAM